MSRSTSTKPETSASIFTKGVVRITVQPTLTRLRGSDDRMASGMRVFAGVAIRRTVAAECYAALLARAKMNPVVADFHALFALLPLRMFYRANRFEM